MLANRLRVCNTRLVQVVVRQASQDAKQQPQEKIKFWDLYEKTYGKSRNNFKEMKFKDLSNFSLALVAFGGFYLFMKNEEKKKTIEKKFEWLVLPYFKHKLFTCEGFVLPEFLARDLDKFKTFETRKDDVWVVSFPKSGTTWVQEIAYLILNDCDFKKATSESIEHRSPFIDYPSPGLKYINNMSSPRIIKTHLPLRFLPENVENKSKVIYIARNPKDVTVSYFHFARLSTQSGYNGTFDDFVNKFIDGTVPYGPWWTHVDENTKRGNIHVIHYEDLHERPYEVVKSLAKFLGKELSESQVESIVKWCSFDSMKQNKSINYEWYKEIGLFRKDGHFFRKGEIGDWLNYFSKEDSLRLDSKLGDSLGYQRKFNFGISDEDLNKIYSFQKQ